jgi:histone H3/H4
VPSTPHALRALQERSANKTRTALRSAGKRKYDVYRIHGDDQVRPGSARGILRRLAKITAKDLKKRPRDSEVLRHIGKENVRPIDDEDEDAIGLKKPRLTLDVLDEEDDSLVLDKSMLPQYEEEDSELPTAPTPSILPDDGDTTNNVRFGEGDRSLTFKSIDFAKVAQEQDGDRRKSRVSFAPSVRDIGVDDEDEDEDPTILTERGRRAVSEDMTGRFSRYSFGSIRMSDFGSELEVRRDSEFAKDVRKSLDANLPPPPLLEGETMDLQDLEQELQLEEGPVVGGDDDGDNDDFQVPPLEEQQVSSGFHGFELGPQPELGSDTEDEDDGLSTAAAPAAVKAVAPTETNLDQPDGGVTTAQPAAKRGKKLKMTSQGALVPSLPSSLIRRIATETALRSGRRRPQLGKDHMKALEQATEWFFEQAGQDLSAYAEHARRKKKIKASDAEMLMRRQRVLEGDGELRQLAEHFLPEKVLDELDLPEDA